MTKLFSPLTRQPPPASEDPEGTDAKAVWGSQNWAPVPGSDSANVVRCSPEATGSRNSLRWRSVGRAAMTAVATWCMPKHSAVEAHACPSASHTPARARSPRPDPPSLRGTTSPPSAACSARSGSSGHSPASVRSACGATTSREISRARATASTRVTAGADMHRA